VVAEFDAQLSAWQLGRTNGTYQNYCTCFVKFVLKSYFVSFAQAKWTILPHHPQYQTEGVMDNCEMGPLTVPRASNVVRTRGHKQKYDYKYYRNSSNLWIVTCIAIELGPITQH